MCFNEPGMWIGGWREDMHKPESLMNLKCGLGFEVRCILPSQSSSCTVLSQCCSFSCVQVRCPGSLYLELFMKLMPTPYPRRRPLFLLARSWLFYFFLPQILSKPTNVSKFGSADFQQWLSNRSDGTSSVKPRVCHDTSFPATLSATYATPAPTASATTLPAGREGQRGRCIKHAHRIIRRTGCANGACEPWRAVSFSGSLITAEMAISEITEMCKTLIQCRVPFPCSKGAVRTVRIFQRKLLILYIGNIIRLSWMYLKCISRWRKLLP